VEDFSDIKTYHGSNGSSHHITRKVTCLMSCHPKYLCSCSIAENGGLRADFVARLKHHWRTHF
jgi:hypothetical protein